MDLKSKVKASFCVVSTQAGAYFFTVGIYNSFCLATWKSLYVKKNHAHSLNNSLFILSLSSYCNQWYKFNNLPVPVSIKGCNLWVSSNNKISLSVWKYPDQMLLLIIYYFSLSQWVRAVLLVMFVQIPEFPKMARGWVLPSSKFTLYFILDSHVACHCSRIKQSKNIHSFIVKPDCRN